ncbi:MAG TPA: hypothetical protein VMQ45_08605 [Burkholderiaceae bacterium]|nr:hypothetical protein [Burkholderiaceae bacterium]
MKNTYRQSDSNLTGLGIGSFLALVVAMAVSLTFGVQPADEASAGIQVAPTIVTSHP